MKGGVADERSCWSLDICCHHRCFAHLDDPLGHKEGIFEKMG